MIERESNRLLLFPVHDRSEETLVTIIKKYVAPGTTIYSDGWSAYKNLKKYGYEHFTVIHKDEFKAVYVNPETKETREVHTNQIEGAWAHAKNHFRKIYGTNSKNFQ